MKRPLTVLIVGGYGTFGGRLAHLLADCEGLTLLIGGRSLERAQQFCVAEANAAPVAPLCSGTGGGRAQLQAVRFDRGRSVEEQLRALAPHVVVDASGPFQAYADYGLVEACISLGIHYLDLADGADFVCGIERFDQRARERDVFVLSGVSSFPVLTAAVVRLLSGGMARVEDISAGIAPSPFANVGLNVIRAIAGYAGKPVRLVNRVGYALTETRRYTIAAPGWVPVDSLEFSLVDVPDIRVLAQLWPECRSVWMGAGPIPAVWHRLLRGLAGLVRLGLLPSLSFLAPLMYRAINVLAWGEHRGGMFVRVIGVDARLGSRVERSWHLVAEGEAGPFIPSMAAEAIIRHCLAGNAPLAGARPAVRELEVSDYEPLLSRMMSGDAAQPTELSARDATARSMCRNRAIQFGVREDTLDSAPEVPLYRRILGRAWDELPASLRAMHSVQSSLVARGRADVTRGTSWLGALAASMVGFPQSGTDVPVEVSFTVTPHPHSGPVADSSSVAPSHSSSLVHSDSVAGSSAAAHSHSNPIGPREIWHRSFAGRTFSSEQFAGHGRFDRLVCERFGPITLAMAIVVEHNRLSLVIRGWSFLGIPLPRALAPQCTASEFERDGLFHFDVAIHHRWTGLIVHYRGWLTPAWLNPTPALRTG